MAKKDEVRDTDIAGIKQRISDGKYIVSLDLGRQMKYDKKSGEMKLKQVKTTRVCNTLREAKAELGKNSSIKNKQKVTGTTKKVNIETAYQDYLEHNQEKWSLSYLAQKNSEFKHIKSYFGNMDIRKISTLDIEKFFKFLKEEKGNSANTCAKHKVLLRDMFIFMKKDFNKYGVTDNPVVDADPGKTINFVNVALTIEEVNSFLENILVEEDKSNLVLFALGLSGLRRAEILGLKWGNIFDNYLEIKETRVQAGSKQVVKDPKNDASIRTVAVPDYMNEIFDIVREQQKEYLQRDLKDDDYVYMTKTNLVNNYICAPGKSSRYYKLLLNRVNKRLRKQGLAEIQPHTLHSLRHTHITLLVNDGVNPKQVSFNVGHSVQKENTTLKKYTHDDNNRDQIINWFNKNITVDFTEQKEKAAAQ